jgi:hypothetical protein
VIGFNAGTGQTGLDRVQIACGELRADGVGPLASTTPERGGPTGTVEKSRCAAGMVVNRFYVIPNPNVGQVSNANFTCANPVTGRTMRDAIGGREPWDRSIGLFGEGRPELVYKQDCPNGEFARGFTINYSSRVIAMAMICERVAATTPQSAPAASTASRQVINAPYAFQGGWQTLSSQNNRFTLVLVVENSAPSRFAIPMTVRGQIINIDGKREIVGWLQGVIPPGSGIIQFTYGVPETRLGGTGVLTLYADDTIAATGQNSDGTALTWNGTRAR